MITVTRQPDGVTLRTDKHTQKSELYAAIKKAGFEITDAERENIPLCSCDEILKNPAEELFYHQDYQIRSMTDSLNLAWERSQDPLWFRDYQPEISLPLIEMEATA